MTKPIPPVTRIYVAACRRDLHLTRLCLSSIRYWHPRIPISLVVDDQLGKCDTSRLEYDWNVDRFHSDVRRFNGGTSKLEMLFLPERERYLVLDSDIVLLGPILDLLNTTSGDFVVHPEAKTPKHLERATYAVKPLAEFDPSFIVPRLVFNTGQYVGTSGILRRDDFNTVLQWTEPRRPLRPDIFKVGEQGLLNYVVAKAEQAGRLSRTWQPLFLWRREDSSEFTVESLATRTSRPFLLHWSGYKPDDIGLMERPDILAFYAAFERKTTDWRSKAVYWIGDQTVKRWSARGKRLWRRFKFCCAGSPLAAGGPMDEIPPGLLHHFHEVEKARGRCWRWSSFESAIEVHVPPGDYRIRIETGSPLPMLDLTDRNLRLFVNDHAVAADQVRIAGGVAEIDLQRGWLDQNGRQLLGLHVTPLDAPEDERSLGIPVSAIYIFRRRN